MRAIAPIQFRDADMLTQLRSQEFQRTVQIDRRAIDEDKRTVDLSFSSEAEVERWYGIEVLDHSQKIRMGRLRNQAPLLLNHNRDQQIGVIDAAKIDTGDKCGRATVRFSRSASGEEIFQDVKDGIRGLVSVGYRVHKVEIEKRGKVELVRAIDWEPFEISIVSIPADTSVGVGRNDSAIELAQETANRINHKESCSINSVPSASTRSPAKIRVALPPHLQVVRLRQ